MSRTLPIVVLATLLAGCCTPRPTRSYAASDPPPATTSSAAAEELPDLIVWVSDSRSYLTDATIDTTTQPGRRLLRFSVATANIGRGNLELDATVSSGGVTRATQIIYHTDGSKTRISAGTFVFDGHADHSHWHFADYAAYNLRAVTAGDGVGAIVASSSKVTFCLEDVVPYAGYDAGSPQYTCSNQGISVGWADVYGRELTGQWIDVTDVPPGTYWLEVTVDPLNRIKESNDSNNTARVKVRVD